MSFTKTEGSFSVASSVYVLPAMITLTSGSFLSIGNVMSSVFETVPALSSLISNTTLFSPSLSITTSSTHSFVPSRRILVPSGALIVTASSYQPSSGLSCSRTSSVTFPNTMLQSNVLFASELNV